MKRSNPMWHDFYLPTYARRFQRDYQRYDRFLRLRRSVEEPDVYLLERKTLRWWWPDGVEPGSDRGIQYRDGVRLVTPLYPPDLPFVLDYLRLNDVQARGGAKQVLQELEHHESRVEELLNRHRITELEAASCEAYDMLAWLEQRRVAMGGHGLGE